MKKTITLAALLTGALLGCGAEDAAPQIEASDDALNAVESGDELVEGKDDGLASTSTYYALRRDFRRCIAPICGGYWVKRVNYTSTRCLDGRYAAECYVADLDLSLIAIASKRGFNSALALIFWA